MIELIKSEMQMENRQSSKGNQMKWFKDDVWYKADYTGYEGLAEYLVSSLLKQSSLSRSEFQLYETEQIKYEYSEYLGCKSSNFLPKGWQMITLERLFYNKYGESLFKNIYKIFEVEDRISFLVSEVEKMTGLKNFGDYMCNLLTLDAFFLNEDRHTHNIAVLINDKGEYNYCPIFDNGGCLLSDTTMDFPMHVDVTELMEKVQAKTFSVSFDDQLDEAERLYGQKFRFNFSIEDVDNIIDDEPYYNNEIKERVKVLIALQMKKYHYLFR